VNVGEVATPFALVVAVVTPPANVPLAPVAGGAANVTSTPPRGDPPPDVTSTTSGAENAALTVALCGVPLVAVIDTTAPVMFVRVKLAGAATPATVAVTI
jgi:hypothetical protein